MLMTEPFASTKRYDLDIKRNQLYLEIKNSLKLESYDSQPIGHNFVMGYEKQVPGMLTAYVGDHSFLNSGEDENRKVIMEAVDSGMAIKAGIAVALATLIFKIISILLNNKDFKKDAPGGGRGSATYKEASNEKASTTVKEMAEARQQALDAIKSNGSNPIHKEDDSPANKALTDVVRITSASLPTPEAQKEAAAKPAEYIATVTPEVDTGGLASLFALEDSNEFKRVINTFSKIQKGIGGSGNINAILAGSGTYIATVSQGTPSEDAHRWYESIFNTFKNMHKEITGEEGSDVSVMREKLLGIFTDVTKYQQTYNAFDDKSKLFNRLKLTEAFEDKLTADENISNRSMTVSNFNEGLLDIITNGRDNLDDSETYKKFIDTINLAGETATKLRDMNTPESTALAEKLVLVKMMVETVLQMLKALVTQRRCYDTVDSFITKNTSLFDKLKQGYINIVSAFNKDGGV